MRDELHIREGTEGDTPQILELLKTSLGEGSIPRDRAYWDWKHRSNPFGSSPVLVAEAGGRLAGLRVFMRWAWEREGERFRSVRAVDTATHPDWRGKGVFTRLTLALLEKMEAEGTAFVFNTPNRLSRPGYLKMGWSAVGRVSLWVHPRRPLRTMGALVRGDDGAGPGTDDGPPTEGGSAVADMLNEPRFEAFLADSRVRDRRLATPRSMKYLRWRYADIPGFEYRAVWTLEGEDGAALIFRHRARGELRELRFTEILAGPSRTAARRAAALLRETIQSSGADYAVAMAAPGTRARRALLLSGFLPVPRLGPVLTVRPLTSRDPATMVLNRSAWRFSIGDLELF